MTNGILTSRLHKNELHKKSLLNPQQFYKTYIDYRNLYNKIVRKSKQLFIDSNFKKIQKKSEKNLGLSQRDNFWLQN